MSILVNRIPDDIGQHVFVSGDSKSWLCWKRNGGGLARVGSSVGHMSTTGYYRFSINGKTFACHRVIWFIINGEIPDGMQVDHIDGNRANNNPENLRLATKTQNQGNKKKASNTSSIHKGVKFNKKSGNWIARLGCRKPERHLGSFESEHAAGVAYDRAASEYFGEFAKLNFPKANQWISEVNYCMEAL